MKTANYKNTFISVAMDCKAKEAAIPPLRNSGKTVANIQFEMISQSPYIYTSDDVIYEVYHFRNRNGIISSREEYFSTGKACLRTSPLAKTYGWGIHHNEEGKVALYGKNSEEYEKLVNDDTINQVNAMRSTRA